MGNLKLRELESFKVASKGSTNPAWAAGSFVELSVVDDSNYPTTPGCRVHRINK